jgi:GxxExxY protein
MGNSLLEEELTASIIGAFFEVYDDSGYGYLESHYQRAMRIELGLRGHGVAMEHPVPTFYKGIQTGLYRVDLLVDKKVIVEVKSTKSLDESANRQLSHYLKGSGLKVGLLLHFGPRPKFYRKINDWPGDERNNSNPAVPVVSVKCP